MAEKQTSNIEEAVLDDIVTTPYKYGFKTDIGTEQSPKGINLNIINQISKKKNELKFLKHFSEKVFFTWQKMQVQSGLTYQYQKLITNAFNIIRSLKQKKLEDDVILNF